MKIIFLSARDASKITVGSKIVTEEDATRDFLKRNNIHYDELILSKEKGKEIKKLSKDYEIIALIDNKLSNLNEVYEVSVENHLNIEVLRFESGHNLKSRFKGFSSFDELSNYLTTTIYLNYI